MQIPVHVPGLLAASVGDRRRFHVDARTLGDALRAVGESYPALRAHVWDETGRQRQHVLVYLNDQSVTWIDDHASHDLRPGDELHIIQAVSGG